MVNRQNKNKIKEGVKMREGIIKSFETMEQAILFCQTELKKHLRTRFYITSEFQKPPFHIWKNNVPFLTGGTNYIKYKKRI
jgi:hypothetical protein